MITLLNDDFIANMDVKTIILMHKNQCYHLRSVDASPKSDLWLNGRRWMHGKTGADRLERDNFI